jgi:hypothetical protein
MAMAKRTPVITWESTAARGHWHGAGRSVALDGPSITWASHNERPPRNREKPAARLRQIHDLRPYCRGATGGRVER